MSYRELRVWQRSMDLAESVYRTTRAFPRAEEHRLSGQLIRAASSIAANLAEGHMRGTRKDYANFVNIARGSHAELETLLLLCERVGLAPAQELQRLLGEAAEVGRMLTRLRQSL